MRQKSGPAKQSAEDAIKDIRRVTRRRFSAEVKIRTVLEGQQGEESIAELWRREGPGRLHEFHPISGSGRLGSRLNQVHQMITAAIATAAAKFVASLSYRVAMRRQCLRGQNMRSIRLRWRYASSSNG